MLTQFLCEDLDEGAFASGLCVISAIDDVKALSHLTLGEFDLCKIPPLEILCNHKSRQNGKAASLLHQVLIMA